MLIEGGNKPRNAHPAHQVLSTLHRDPYSYSPFPQESHYSSSVPEHSTNWNPNREHREERILLCLQARWIMCITRIFATDNPDFSQHGGKKKTHFTKKFLKMPQLNTPDVISFVAIRLYLLVHILIKTKQAKIICLLMTLFFLKNCLPFSRSSSPTLVSLK